MNNLKLAKSSIFTIVALGLAAVATMGAQSCAEPKEYCAKAYASKTDVKECTEYCANNKDYKAAGGDQSQNLIRACNVGQFTYLEGTRSSAAEGSLQCDRNFKDFPIAAAACRDGVTAEDLRTSKSRVGPGSSNDRETGNRK